MNHASRRTKFFVSFGLVAAFTVAFTVAFPIFAFASGYKIGNGDDGSDLEGGKQIKSGILVQARDKALERAKGIGTYAVDHLGSLIPELEKADIYLVDRNLHPRLKNDSGMESSKDGTEVYARTFAEPHAATRFFPAALKLNEEQLIALHVHEALHRSLPASVREDEAVVTKITLAITAQDASLDRVRRVVSAEIPETALADRAGVGQSSLAVATETKPMDRPSTVTYSYTSFFLPTDEKDRHPIDSLHSLKTVFYPLGNNTRALGFGMQFSYFKTPDRAFMGPLDLSARLGLANLNNYEVSAFVDLSLNTMAGEEIKNSPLGRDVTTIGVDLRRDEHNYYVEDSFSVSLAGDAKRKVGTDADTFHYGQMLEANVHAGAKIRNFEVGGFAQLLLSDSYKESGTTSSTADNKGRFHILGLGPEFAFVKDAMRFSTSARWIVNSTPGVSLDEIGDLMGTGVGQGFVSASASLRF